MTATVPTNMPVTLAEAKAHLRVTHNESDTEILGYLLAGIEYAEARAQRVFRGRTLTLVLDDFPGSNDPIRFAQSPVNSVDTITYYDSSNVSQSLTTGTLILTADSEGVACVYPAYDGEWPDTVSRPDAVTISYTGGYGDVASVPQRAKQAILLMTQHGYDQRSPVVVGTISKPIELAVASMLRSLKPGNYPDP